MESQNAVASLQTLVLERIERSLDDTKPFTIPSPIVLQLLDYLMKRRKVGW